MGHNADIESPTEFLDRMSSVMGDRECERMVAERDARVRADALREAANAIQALHPGEIKNSVIFLRERANRIPSDKSQEDR